MRFILGHRVTVWVPLPTDYVKVRNILCTQMGNIPNYSTTAAVKLVTSVIEYWLQ